MTSLLSSDANKEQV